MEKPVQKQTMRIAVITNPCSGGKRAVKMLPDVKAKFEGAGITAEIFTSRHSSHIQEIAGSLDIDRYDAIAAMGGDGTNFHMINGLLSHHSSADLPPLAILPAGSGNSFARDLNIFDTDQAIAAIRRNRPRPVDMIAYTGGSGTFYFVNLMGAGFVTDVAVTASRFKYLHDLSYLIGVVRQTVSIEATRMEIDIDGKVCSGRFTFVEFCNSRFTGGNMLMAPDAKIDDGLMDIILVRELSRRELLLSLPKIYSGTHLDMDQVTCIKGKSVKIITPDKEKTFLPDGEILGKTPGTLEVIPRALRYLE
ncbi:MAG: diacylglycerol kinase family lipid kinase [Desulfobacterales bacterium]|nr:diacylglycerol kinase family lipid kinase [Desulfobacterales bacterium]